MDKLHWAVDSLVLRGGTIFGHGWVFHEEEEIQAVELAVTFADGQTKNIAADAGKPRGDVAETYSQHLSARSSGYLVYGSFHHEPAKLGEVFLVGALANGGVFKLEVPESSWMQLSEQQTAPARRVVARQAALFLKRGLRLIRQGAFRSLFEKAKSQLVTRPKSYIGEAKLIRAILKAHEQGNIVLVIDHHLGGGANHYRDRLVAQKIADGATVFIFSYHVATLSHILVVRNKRLNERYAIPGSKILLELASQAVIKEIIYNNAVSFAKPESIPQFIVALKNQSNARLILLVHDFFMACPSYTLLDDRGAFCGIPDDTTCQKCLRKNEQGFATLFAARDIQQWRVMWQAAIACADEVRAFSKSSVQLMTKAYPEMDLSRVVVKPHELGYLPAGPVYPSYTAALRIGVVGGISYHKGVRFVEDLSQEIKRRGLEIQIVIIGTIETACDPSVVRQTGPYRHDQLPSLIQASGANIMLFPSIWPETFSYVVHELVELELPVACFDMGAQAECIADYAKGLILGEPNASAILDDLVAFHQRTYLSS